MGCDCKIQRIWLVYPLVKRSLALSTLFLGSCYPLMAYIVSGWTSPKPKMKRCSCKLARSTKHRAQTGWQVDHTSAWVPYVLVLHDPSAQWLLHISGSETLTAGDQGPQTSSHQDMCYPENGNICPTHRQPGRGVEPQQVCSVRSNWHQIPLKAPPGGPQGEQRVWSCPKCPRRFDCIKVLNFGSLYSAISMSIFGPCQVVLDKYQGTFELWIKCL